MDKLKLGFLPVKDQIWSYCPGEQFIRFPYNFKRRSSCAKTQEAYRPQRILSMAGSGRGGGEPQ